MHQLVSLENLMKEFNLRLLTPQVDICEKDLLNPKQ